MLIEMCILIGGVGYIAKKNINKEKPTYSQLKQLSWDLKHSITNQNRSKLEHELDAVHHEMEATHQYNHKQVVLSASAIGLTLATLAFPSLYLVGTIAVIYLARDVFRWAWETMQRGRYLNVYVSFCITLLAMLATGHIILAAIDGFLTGLYTKLIERAEDNSQRKLINVYSDYPSEVWVLQEGVEIQVSFDQLKKNDLVIVNAGEIIPIDGKIHQGDASIDQHILTGESQPIDKSIGDEVFASTLLISGRIVIQTETTGSETTTAKIGQLLNNTQEYKDSLVTQGQSQADRFVPWVLGLSAITYPILGAKAAIAVNWAGLGESMVELGSLSLLNYLQILSKNGILVKDGRVFETLQIVDTFVFDKTGTLTEEQPGLYQIHCFNEHTEASILQFAATAEFRQTHPIARAILHAAEQQNIEPEILEHAHYAMGHGLKVSTAHHLIHLGSERFLQQEGIKLMGDFMELKTMAHHKGHSLVYLSVNQTLAGIIELEPTVRSEAQELIQTLKSRGMQTYMISGDHESATQQIAQKLEIDHYFPQTLPKDKAKLVRQLKKEGKVVCFVGDGINDSIALKSAHVSISLKGASSVATDTAQIIFMDGHLRKLEQLLVLSDDFSQTMRTNLKTSLIPGIITIFGAYAFHFGIATAMALYYSGYFIGLVNSISPLSRFATPQLENKETKL